MKRSAFTLLEVLLALSIALLLMGGLYVAMDTQLFLVEDARNHIDDSALARALMNRLGGDVAGAVTPIRSSPAAAASTSTTSSTSSATAATATADTTGSIVLPLNGGIIGDNGRLIILMSRVPAGPRGDSDGEPQTTGGGDLRKVTYWHEEGLGLIRQETSRVTADDGDSDQANLSDQVIAAEVEGLNFRYFDGTTWSDSWDGTAVGEDGVTPIGPPRAVEITMGIRSPSQGNAVQQFRHVAVIQSANAQPASTTTAEEATQ